MSLYFLLKFFSTYKAIDTTLNSFSDMINYNLFIISLNACLLIFICILFIYCLIYLIQNLNEMSLKNICAIIVVSILLVIIAHVVLNIFFYTF